MTSPVTANASSSFLSQPAGLATIIGTVLGVLLVLSIVMFVLIIRRRRRLVDPDGVALPPDDFVQAIRTLRTMNDEAVEGRNEGDLGYIDMDMFAPVVTPISFNMNI